MHFLIISANFYKDISEILVDGAIDEITKEGHTYHKITVPGAFEIPSIISFASDSGAYDGFVALGCIIKGATINHEIIAYECARGLNELAMNMNLAIGNGVITANNKSEAMERAKKRNKGAFAAKTTMKLAKIRDKFHELLVSN